MNFNEKLISLRKSKGLSQESWERSFLPVTRAQYCAYFTK